MTPIRYSSRANLSYLQELVDEFVYGMALTCSRISVELIFHAISRTIWFCDPHLVLLWLTSPTLDGTMGHPMLASVLDVVVVARDRQQLEWNCRWSSHRISGCHRNTMTYWHTYCFSTKWFETLSTQCLAPSQTHEKMRGRISFLAGEYPCFDGL